MKPIKQTILGVDKSSNTVLVQSKKGNCYNVDLNHYCKDINVGDTALVVKSNVSREWLMVDVEPQKPTVYKPLDVTDFPRDNNGDLNIVEHGKYLQIIEDMPESEKRDFDNYLLTKWGVTQ